MLLSEIYEYMIDQGSDKFRVNIPKFIGSHMGWLELRNGQSGSG